MHIFFVSVAIACALCVCAFKMILLQYWRFHSLISSGNGWNGILIIGVVTMLYQWWGIVFQFYLQIENGKIEQARVSKYTTYSKWTIRRSKKGWSNFEQRTHIFNNSEAEQLLFVASCFVQHHYLIVINVCPSCCCSQNSKQRKKCERTTECYTEFNAQFMYLSVHNFSCGYFNMVNTMFVLNILECKILWLQCFFSFYSIYNVPLYMEKNGMKTWCVFATVK